MRNLLLVAAAASLWTSSAGASVLFDSGTPTGTAWSFDYRQYFAGQFKVGEPYTITGASAYLSSTNSNSGSVTIQIRSGGANVPGRVLLSKSFVLQSGSPENWYGLDDLGWQLNAGTYWLAFVPDAKASGSWRGGAPNSLPHYARYLDNQWNDYGTGYFDFLKVGMRLSGTAVSAAVPEPSTWAMLLVGFGVVGYSLRRRPKQPRAQAI